MRRSVISALVLLGAACGDRARATAGAADTPRPDFSLRDTACVATLDGEGARTEPPVPRLAAARRLSCVIEDGSPPRALVLVADTAAGLVTGILLLDASGTDTVQRLAVEQDEPPVPGVPYFVATDFDADGARDLALRRWAGATGNVGHEVWRFDRRDGRFVHDSALSATVSIRPVPDRPCVEGRTKGGMAGLEYEAQRLCRAGGRWRVEWEESQEADVAAGRLVRRVREWRGDSVALIRVDTLALPRP